jgi:aspartate aminotransferase
VDEERTALRFSQASIHGLGPSATLSMNERVREMWDQGRKVYQLGFGESRFPVPSEVAEAMRANTHRRSYLPALGIEELREVIAQFYLRRFQMVVSPSQVVIGPGSKSLLYALIMALGEGVVLPQPSWVSYSTQAQMVGRPVLRVPMRFESGYVLEVESLREGLEKARAKRGSPDLLIVNRPHNPTGTMMPPEKVQALAEFAREEHLMVLSDEIYALVDHGRIAHKSIGNYYPEGTVVLGGLSKHLSLGGWRLGVAILPAGPAGEELGRTLRSIAGSIWSCVSAPLQYAALVAYSHNPAIDSYIEVCARIHAVRTRYLYERLVEAGIACIEPSGAFYTYPSFNRWRKLLAANGIESSNDLAKHLLDEYELATLPGSAFGSPPGDLSLRLSSSYLDTGTDAEAANLLRAFGEDPDPESFIENHHPQLREASARLADFAAALERKQGLKGTAGSL